MANTHHYSVGLEWTGNLGTGTSGYRAYTRDHAITAAGKPALAGSADAVFRGDATRWNPEELLVASLAACHQLAYLHLCADAKIVVTAYTDQAEGTLEMAPNGAGRMQRVTLRPKVTVAAGTDLVLVKDLHHSAHAKCFIANSVNFPVGCEAEILVAG